MKAVAEDLLSWAFTPLDHLNQNTQWSRQSFWVGTLLVALAAVSDWGIDSLGESLFFVSTYLLLLFGWHFLQALTADFWGQALGKKGQSLRLFTWLVMAQLPMVLVMPLTILSDLIPTLSTVFTLGIISSFLYTVWLQIRILMHHYKLSFGLGFLFLVSPILFLLLVPMVLSAAGILWGVMGS